MEGERKRKIRREKKSGRLNAAFSGAFRRSFIARFLLFFGAFELKIQESAAAQKVSAFIHRRNFGKKIVIPVRQVIAKELSQSVLLNAVSAFFEMLLCLPLRAYGAFLLAFSGGSAVVTSLNNYRVSGELMLLSSAILFGIGVLLSLILLSSSKGKCLGRAVFESKVGSYLLFELLGVRKNAFENAQVCEANYAVILIAALVLSVLTLWAAPVSFFFITLWILFIRLALCSPESGFVALILLFPFVPLSACAMMIVTVAAAYLIKLLRGKRVYRASFFGLVFFLFAVLALFGTVMTPVSGDGTPFPVMFAVLCVFFLARTMMDRRELIIRAMTAFAFSALVSALWTSVMFAAWYLPEEYKSVITIITQYKYPGGMISAGSTGIFIGAVCGVMIARYQKTKTHAGRVLMVLGVILIAAGAIVSRSPGAWIALIAALLILRIFNKNIVFIPAVLVSAALSVVYVFVLPTFITKYVSGFSTGFEVTASSVLESLKECLARFLVGAGEAGVGAGGNFYNHILSANGIVGLILLLFTVIGVLSFAYYAVVKNALISRQMRSAAFGFSSSILAMLICGFFFDFAKDPKLLIVFFCILGLIPACGRVLLRECEVEMRQSETDIDFVFSPVRIGKRKDGGVTGDPVSYVFEEKPRTRREEPDAGGEEQVPPENGDHGTERTASSRFEDGPSERTGAPSDAGERVSVGSKADPEEEDGPGFSGTADREEEPSGRAANGNSGGGEGDR